MNYWQQFLNNIKYAPNVHISSCLVNVMKVSFALFMQFLRLNQDPNKVFMLFGWNVLLHLFYFLPFAFFVEESSPQSGKLSILIKG